MCLVYSLYITIISLKIKTNLIKVHQPSSDSSFAGAIVHTVNSFKYLQSLNKLWNKKIARLHSQKI